MRYKWKKLNEAYKISSEGEVKGIRTLWEVIAGKPSPHKVSYSSNDQSYTCVGAPPFTTYELTWVAFNGMPKDGLIIDHINLYQLYDNALSNLELVTAQQWVDKRLKIFEKFSMEHLIKNPSNWPIVYENVFDGTKTFQLRTLREEIEYYVFRTDHKDLQEFVDWRLANPGILFEVKPQLTVVEDSDGQLLK